VQGAAIVNAESGMHDVVLRDFVIEAGLQEKPTRDPNQDSRPRRSQMAPSRGGIAFRADGSDRIRNVQMEHVTILHATLSGVDIFGADLAKIVDCDITGSGGAVAPGAGQHANLKLNQCTHADVSGSRLADSLCGSGVYLLGCAEINLSNCELSRNSCDGIRNLDSTSVSTTRCLFEANEGFAIGLESGASIKPHAPIGNSNIIRCNAEYANRILRA